MANATLAPGRSPAAPATFTQDNPLLRIDTVLGKDRLLLTRLAGEEKVSEPFLYRATMLSEDREIAPERRIGSPATIWLRSYRGGETPISGVVRGFAAGSVDARGLREYCGASSHSD
jgi:type VI secretion system secreted protein VgrG